MAEIWFYHLQKRRLEDVLPLLLQKTLERGWRACVEGTNADRLSMLDGHLWTYADDTFLPHGPDGEQDSTDQPVLLTSKPANANRADVRFLIDAAEVDDPGVYERVIYLFDGRDPHAVDAARDYWRRVTSGDHDAVYWKENDRGVWERKDGV